MFQFQEELFRWVGERKEGEGWWKERGRKEGREKGRSIIWWWNAEYFNGRLNSIHHYIFHVQSGSLKPNSYHGRTLWGLCYGSRDISPLSGIFHSLPFPAYQSICELHGCYYLVSFQLSSGASHSPMCQQLKYFCICPLLLMSPCISLFTASTPFTELVHVVSGLSPSPPSCLSPSHSMGYTRVGSLSP